MQTEKLAVKYHGDMADTYDALRVETPQWNNEQAIVGRLLEQLEPGTRVLDIPVGTGRFLQTYAARGLDVTGIDISSSMLEQAAVKAEAEGMDVTLQLGNIKALEFPDGEFDVVVCIRFMDWVDAEFLASALTELERVASKTIIVYVPTYTPLGDLKIWTPAGMLRWLRQIKFRLYRKRTSDDSISHNQRRLYSLFDQLGLTVLQRTCIDDQSERFWQVGSDRDIYELRVRGHN